MTLLFNQFQGNSEQVNQFEGNRSWTKTVDRVTKLSQTDVYFGMFYIRFFAILVGRLETC